MNLSLPSLEQPLIRAPLACAVGANAMSDRFDIVAGLDANSWKAFSGLPGAISFRCLRGFLARCSWQPIRLADACADADPAQPDMLLIEPPIPLQDEGTFPCFKISSRGFSRHS
jgi:hypothetical protein